MSAALTIIQSVRLVTDGVVTENGWVMMSPDGILATGSGDSWNEVPHEFADDVEIITAEPGSWLTPGFIDIHCHGGGGESFDNGADAIATALAVHRAHGTTRTVLSLVTASIDDLVARVAVIAGLTENDPLILGSHLEGPFLDPGHKGAHDPLLLVAATPESVARLLDAARGTIRQVTLAPELPGADDAIRAFTDAGVVVAVGHTDAGYTQTRAAFDAGATLITHAFNGMNPLHHREPGPVAAATHDDTVILELINDGIHVHPEMVRIVFASAPGRVALITDAMAAAGSSDGDYLLGSLAVTVTDGVARLAGGGSIAGSTLTLDDALRRAVNDIGINVGEAVRALTETPAHAIGRSDDLGRLASGFAADAVLLTADFVVNGVWANGTRIR